MKTPKYLLLLFFSSSFSFAMGQIDFRPGYVVKNQADTLRGLINYSSKRAFKKVLFKKNRKSEIIAYTPSQISGYGFDYDKQYLSIELPQKDSLPKKVFVKIVDSGPLNLYRYENRFYAKKDADLVELPVPVHETITLPDDQVRVNHSSVVLKKDVRYITNLEALVNDCLFLDKKMKYSEGTFSNVVKSYNHCKGVDSQPKNDTRPALKVNLSVFGVYARSKFEIDRSPRNRSFSPSYTFGGGLAVDLSAPRVTDRLFFTAEAWYLKALYQGYYEGKSSYQTYREDLLLNVSYVKVPAGFRYNFINGIEKSIYLKAGVYIIPFHNYSMLVTEEKEAFGIVTVDKKDNGYEYKTPKGGWLSVGYDQILFGRTRLFSELRYERGEGYVGSAIQSFSKISNINLVAGLRF